MKLFKKAKKGFTLVELVVVIAVIAILAGVSVGAYFGITESAKNSQVEQEAKSVYTSITLIANDPKYEDVTLGTDGLSFDKDTIRGYLTEVTGLTYTIVIHADNEDAPTAAECPAICFNDDDKATTFTYFVDASHFATYELSTGAKAGTQHAPFAD